MNKLNFNQSIGFPLETNILSEMQTAWSILNALGNIAGNFSILTGCNVSGTTVSDGVVFINGEVIEFKGGQVQENVIIIELREALEFEDGNANDLIFTRYATFGVATTQWTWDSFTRPIATKTLASLFEKKEDKTTVASLLERVEELEKQPSNIPIGMIAIWDRPASEIPEGWTEYVDLRGRMPIGQNPDDSDFSSLRSSGGQKEVQLIPSNIPALTVSVSNSAGSDTGGGAIVTGNPNEGAFNITTTADGKEKVELMNPYRIVHFIKYTG